VSSGLAVGVGCSPFLNRVAVSRFSRRLAFCPRFQSTGHSGYIWFFVVSKPFLANGLFTAVIAFVYWYPVFSTKLLLLASPWVVTGPGSIWLLAIYFKRRTTSISAMTIHGE